jgi:predicted DNA-binding transcriptional regulator AlpA
MTTTGTLIPARQPWVTSPPPADRNATAPAHQYAAGNFLDVSSGDSSFPAHMQSMTSPTTPTQPKLLSIQDLADFLSIPVLTIYQWRSKHKGPRAMRIGRHLRWDDREVTAWLLTQLDDWDADYEVVA